MASPFKIIVIIAVLSILAAGVMGWFLSAVPARDELGLLPGAPEAAPPTEQPASSVATAPVTAPVFELPDPGSGTFSLASYRGKSPVLLYFFATW
jgi:hypothetical protein